MAEPVCPYCRMPFDEASPPKIFCTACGMPHHEDCYQENGGCTVFGCKRAPADDPKLQVSQSDLSAVSMPVQQYASIAQQYTPTVQQAAVQQAAPVQGYQPARYSGPLGLSQAAAAAPAAIQIIGTIHKLLARQRYSRSGRCEITYPPRIRSAMTTTLRVSRRMRNRSFCR